MSATRLTWSRDSAVEGAVIDYLHSARASEDVARSHLVGTGAVARLEKRLREHYGKRHALCVSNATSGLFAFARALHLDGASVICGAFGWGGTIAGPLHVGASITIADVDARTLTLCPASAAGLMTRSTRAVVAADVFGVPPDGAALRRLADAYGLVYIHDAAQGFGATRDGRPSGSLADVVVLSFGAGKTLFAGEGGAILTDDDELYARLTMATQHPYRQKRDVSLRDVDELALNFRIHPLAAVWANADFDGALARVAARQLQMRCVVGWLDESGLTESLRYAADRIDPSYFGFSARWIEAPAGKRLARLLATRGIRARVCPFSLRHLRGLSPLRSSAHGTPVADRQAKRRFELVQVTTGGQVNRRPALSRRHASSTCSRGPNITAGDSCARGHGSCVKRCLRWRSATHLSVLKA